MATASALDVFCEVFDDEVRVNEAGRLAEPKRIGEILPAVLVRLGLDELDLGQPDWREH